MPRPFCYIQKRYIPLEEARLPVMTHAFLYGTAVFEGVRGNWSEERGESLIFRPIEHFTRLKQSAHIMHIELPQSAEELADITANVIAGSGYHEDTYIRPIAYKSGEVIGPKLDGVESDFLCFAIPFGNYLDPYVGLRCQTSTWRRVSDTAIPARAKVNGLYVNAALAKTEAVENGYDEAILLNDDGHAAEGSGENLVMVRHGRLITPARSDNVLEGITLDSIFELARKELGIEVIERTIDRSELYIADEAFLTGTAAHISPIAELDRRAIGNGKVGPITKQLQDLFFDIIRGKNSKYEHWVRGVKPVEDKIPAAAATA